MSVELLTVSDAMAGYDFSFHSAVTWQPLAVEVDLLKLLPYVQQRGDYVPLVTRENCNTMHSFIHSLESF